MADISTNFETGTNDTGPDRIRFTTEYGPHELRAGRWYWDRRHVFYSLLSCLFWAFGTFAAFMFVPFSLASAIWPEVYAVGDVNLPLALILVVLCPYFLWQTCVEIGTYRYERRKTPEAAFKGAVDGISGGIQDLDVSEQALTLSMRDVTDRYHWSAITRMFRWRDFVMFKCRWPEVHPLRHPLGAKAAKQTIKQMKALRRSNPQEVWAIPDAGWTRSSMMPEVCDDIHSDKQPPFSFIGTALVCGFGIGLMGYLAYDSLVSDTWLDFWSAAVPLFLLYGLVIGKLPWAIYGAQRRLNGLPPLGVAMPGINCGPSAFRLEGGRVHIHRARRRRSFEVSAISSAKEQGDWVVLFAGPDILEILPKGAETRQVLRASALVLEGGPWQAADTDSIWRKAA